MARRHAAAYGRLLQYLFASRRPSAMYLLRLNCTIVIMDRKRHRRHRIIEQYHLMNSSPPPPLHSLIIFIFAILPPL